jgi:glycerol-3-phosphate acyltransferase PlsY
VVWGLIFIIKKTSSIAALVSIVLVLITNILLFDSENFPINLMCILVLCMHYQNIYRLLKAKEKKIS